MDDQKLSEEEQDVLDTFEAGEWQSDENWETEIHKARRYARATFKKDRCVNFRISEKNPEVLQKRPLKKVSPTKPSSPASFTSTSTGGW